MGRALLEQAFSSLFMGMVEVGEHLTWFNVQERICQELWKETSPLQTLSASVEIGPGLSFI